ncbi:MAG: pyruvoyl-dependent arginine decarboxylase [Phycisphaerae bacterium SM23_30]|nr:MAG: pyruvoyl-dependent arginine decarboxylase [Phycisphaerae bacterium SM23_30]
MVPKEIFFTRGLGRHRHKLQSFEAALREAGIAICNLVNVSSIFPPGCKIISRKQGIAKLRTGEIIHCVMARSETCEPSRQCCAGIGLAVPGAGSHYGYISEFHGHGKSKREVADLVEDMAATMLATTLGIEFDPDKAYDERKEIYLMSGKIVKTQATVQVGQTHQEGVWTTVLAAAVFVPVREE